MNTKRTYHLCRTLVLTLCALIGIRTAHGQQDPMYSMYMWNMLSVMPGYAGSADVLNVTALSRMQWSSINGAPVTHNLSGHSPVNHRSLGAGGSIVHDRIGRTYTTSVFGDLAYRMRISRKTRLAFGLKAGLNHAQIQNTRVENTDPNDPTFATDQSGKLFPNFGFGMYLWSKRGYMGIAIPKLMRNYLGSSTVDGLTDRFHQEATHLFFTAGYVLPVGTMKLKPSMMMRATEGVPLSIDLSASLFIQDKVSVGMAYRHANSVVGLFSMQMTDQFRAGYAYDLGITRLNTRPGGSHEIMISYDPVFTRERVRSPRYF